MPRFTAQVWVSGDHPYDCEINAANVFQAKKNIARREGVDESDVNRIFLVNDDDDNSSKSSSFSGDDSDGMVALAGGVCALAVAWWLLPWIVSVALIYGTYKVSKDHVNSAALAAIVAVSGIGGFAGGKAIKGEFDAPTPAPIEEVRDKDSSVDN